MADPGADLGFAAMAANIAAQAGTVNLHCKARRRAACYATTDTGRFDEWRRRPELNRRTRFCRPLRNHSATTPRDKRKGGSPNAKPRGRCPRGLLQRLEREKGLEPSTSTLARLRSTN